MKTPFTLFQKILLGILAALIVCIAGGSVWALTRGKDGAQGGGSNSNAVNAAEDIKNYTGLGRLRLKLRPPKGGGEGATVVVTPVFPYNSADKAFTAELAARLRDFRAASGAFFAGLDADSPLLLDDAALKDELRSRYNALLRLGQIDELYLTELMIID